MTDNPGTPAGVLPDLDDPLLAPYWDAARDDRLLVPSCGACGTDQWPPRPSCTCCGETSAPAWREVAGTGSLFTWTVVHHTRLAGFRSATPYVVGLIALDDATVRMVGRLVDVVSDELMVEQPLRVRFVDRSARLRLPVWAPAAVEARS